jgi:hypothetical protein
VGPFKQPGGQRRSGGIPTQFRLGGEPAGGEPTYNFTPHVTCTTLAVPASEKCQTKGYGSSGDVAWECVEIFVSTNHAGNLVDIYSVGIFSCKTATGTYINCGFMALTSALADVDHVNGSMVVVYSSRYGCSGNCPASGPADVASGHQQQSGTESATNDCAEVWGDDSAANGPEQLAGASFTGDFSGPHVNICARDQMS